MEEKTQEAAAAAAGMSVRSARTWESGALPSTRKSPRSWRTRSDPFADVWSVDVLPLLQSDDHGALEAATVWEVLDTRYPGRFRSGQLRTLQRRIRDWRAEHGPHKEVFFEQVHPPGREAACDFTHATELGVTIAGEVLVHLLFDFVLSFSKWRYVCVCYGETFEALVAGLQGALVALGGVPAIVRSDNLSAATHELAEGGRALNRRFSAVLDHYGLQSTRIRPGEAHENGVAEKANDLLKRALTQALVVRGHRDFDSVEEYEIFVAAVVERSFNRHAQEKLAQERLVLRSLPALRVPEYTEVDVVVRKWSTVRVLSRTYSVPSQLIGHKVVVRVHPNTVDVWHHGTRVQSMPRMRGERGHRIDYRHVIWSLVRKPGAFARYRFREDLFPSVVFRRAYDALVATHHDRSDIEYVRILHLAASTMESTVEVALTTLLDLHTPFDYAAVKRLAAPRETPLPTVHIARPDLSAYDGLLMAGAQ